MGDSHDFSKESVAGFFRACTNLLGLFRTRELRYWKIRNDLREIMELPQVADGDRKSLSDWVNRGEHFAGNVRKSLIEEMALLEEYERQLARLKEDQQQRG